MATAGKINVDVCVDIPEDVKRLRALELAVEARGDRWSSGALVEDAGKYLAFLKGDSDS